MVDFTRNRRVKSSQSSIRVDPGLKLGSYLFQLTVVDEDGNRSQPAKIRVDVVKLRIIGRVPSITRPSIDLTRINRNITRPPRR